jgi:mono/diheme cytochrome c family protein
MRRWTIPVAVLSILCLALALPVLAEESKKDDATPDTTPAGQQVFVAQKCQMCHTVYSAGIGEPPAEDAKEETEEAEEGPPDLSLAGTGRTAEWLSLFLQKEETLNEKKHMMAFKGADEELVALANWILTLKAPEVKAAPAKTAKVEKAAEVEAPAEPEAPAESEAPAEPEVPAEPEAPAEAEVPAEPEAPTEPEAPAVDAQKGE